VLKLTIDNQPVAVPAGTKVIAAAEKLGIMIPRFCYHPALGSVGACRVCAVSVLKGPRTGIQMSCMLDVEDGMVVATGDPAAVAFRRQVIEWLMANHPHDCPVCDEGGHCLLQDLTVSGGHGRRRFPGKKRTHRDQQLGPLIQHEMNRCIQCYRCVRFYREFAGYPDLGVTGIAARVYFGRFREGTLESPFAGNLIDICPTGVFTDKPSRYKGRRWDFQRSPSICIHCSLGCHTTVSARYREIVRIEARFSPTVNGHFICDRGRYGFAYANAPERPRQGRIDGETQPVSTALDAALERLTTVSRTHGPDAVACIGSARSSLETLGALKRLCERRSWRGPFLWPDAQTARAVQTAAACLAPELRLSMKELEDADFILVVGADPVNEAPMLALALRQAQRQGATIAVCDPRPVALPFAFEHLALAPPFLADAIRIFARAAAGPPQAGVRASGGDAHPPDPNMPPAVQARLAAMGATARTCRRPVIVCGTQIVNSRTVARAADTARMLKSADKPAGLFFVLPGANAFAAALLSDENGAFNTLQAGIADGHVKAVLAVESDLPAAGEGLAPALKSLDLLVVCDYLNTAAARAADILVPTRSVFEEGGIFINQTGCAQRAAPVHVGGTPVAQTGGGDHPPRTFERSIPGAEALSAVQALDRLAGTETADPPAALADLHPVLAPFASRKWPDEGQLLDLSSEAAPSADWPPEEPPAAGKTFELVVRERTFGSEALSQRADCLRPLEKAPRILVHSDDAARLGIAAGDRVALTCAGGVIEGTADVRNTVAAGVVIVDRHRELNWPAAGAGWVRIEAKQIHKIEKERER